MSALKCEGKKPFQVLTLEAVPDRGGPTEYAFGGGGGQAEVRGGSNQEEDAGPDHGTRDVPGCGQQAEPRLAEDHQETGPSASISHDFPTIYNRLRLLCFDFHFGIFKTNTFSVGIAVSLRRGDPPAAAGSGSVGSSPEEMPDLADGIGRDENNSRTDSAQTAFLFQALRGKRHAEQMYEEAHSKVNELTTINVNLSAAKNKLESDFTTLQSDYEEVSKELRVVDERFNRTVIELKTVKDQLTEEQERLVKIESIKKSLELEVHNLQVRIEEVEANALAGGRRVISKLEARVRALPFNGHFLHLAPSSSSSGTEKKPFGILDFKKFYLSYDEEHNDTFLLAPLISFSSQKIKDVEIEMEEEKRRHSETQKSMRKKENRLRELLLQTEDDHKTITMLNDAVEKLSEKVKMYKRQLDETVRLSSQSFMPVQGYGSSVVKEGISQQNLSRVRRFQRELEAAEDRAEAAEGNLSMIRAKHRSWVTTNQIPGGVRQVFVTEETTSNY
ncbi:UNVERIFIED_CONTAM: Paramyosin [Trichonephila clavipes]